MKKNSTPICPKFDENTFLVMTEVELCWKEEVSKSCARSCKFHICLVVLAPFDKLMLKLNDTETFFALGCVHSEWPI